MLFGNKYVLILIGNIMLVYNKIILYKIILFFFTLLMMNKFHCIVIILILCYILFYFINNHYNSDQAEDAKRSKDFVKQFAKFALSYNS